MADLFDNQNEESELEEDIHDNPKKKEINSQST